MEGQNNNNTWNMQVCDEGLVIVTFLRKTASKHNECNDKAIATRTFSQRLKALVNST